jgi:pentatricopeptide repeat protein
LKGKLKSALKRILPFLALAAIYVLLRATVLNFINTFNLYGGENAFTSNFHLRLFTFFRILTVYFSLLFWPFNLHMERSVEIAASLFSPSVIFGGFIFLGLLALAFSQFKRFPVLSFGILWFFIGLAPTSNILVPISGLLYEHWLYLPMIGIFLVVIWLGLLAAKKYNILGKILLGLFAVLLIFLSVLTINRNKDWRNPIVFYSQTLKYAPNSYRVVNNLGMAYADKGDYGRAKEMYLRAVKIDPSVAVAYHNLGNVYKAMGKNDLAIKNFETAIKLNPKFVFSYNALVSIYLKNKNYQEARKVLEKYLNYSDSKVNVLFALAQVSFKEKDLKGALDYLEKALKIDPESRVIQANIINVKNLIESGE